METILLKANDLGQLPLYSQLQGNILKGHGRDYTHNIFIRFKKGKEKEARLWLTSFAYVVTSCQRQLWERERYNTSKIKGDVFYNIFLSATGYQTLGFDTSKMEDAFEGGMRGRTILNDDCNKFDAAFKEEIHAMILIGDDDISRLSENAFKRIESLEDIADIVTVEYGRVIRNPEGEGIEHFGYVDGISQPLFFQDEVDEFEKRNGGKDQYDPSAGTDLVLVKDPFVGDENAFGSYFVFRKLEQNVRDFKEKEEELAEKALEFEGENKELAGAMLVGRFEDGTPVTLSYLDGISGAETFNNFNYHDDGFGAKCPFHSHIRKTSPRSTLVNDSPRIARRGIPYGLRNVPTEIEHQPIQMPTGGVGLLFMCFQASIENQFEAIQNFANNPDFPTTGAGMDPIIGQKEKKKEKEQDKEKNIGQNNDENISTGKFAKEYNEPASLTSCDFKSFVTTKGGEYFFAPSITFLKNLS